MGPAEDPNLHPHQTELPTIDQVAMIWISEQGLAPTIKGAWLTGRDGAIHTLPFEPICFPL